ncbi:hypothetical protein BG004_003652 [Podila humilis]|nr:hypothetical protein BG004_003652 [Podila humilis]
MRLHQQTLEKTLNNTLTIVDEKQEQQQQQRMHNKKKKKYYPWVQRDSQRQREKIGQEGNKFVHHPMAVLYAVDMPFPGYGHDAPSFHWRYDSVIDSLIRNNPPSSRRSRVRADGSDDSAALNAGPMIGHRCLSRAQRKDIKKVHVPQGIVMQYEGELVDFLDQLSLSLDSVSSFSETFENTSKADQEDGKNEETEAEQCENDDEGAASEPELVSAGDTTDGDDTSLSEDNHSKWVIVPNPNIDNNVASSGAAADEENQKSGDQKAVVETDQDRPQIYLRWDIPDQFLRFVAHALCSFYGLISFSKTALDGKRWVYVCHPTHLNSIGALSRQKTLEHVQDLPIQELDQLWLTMEAKKVEQCLRPDMTFFEYLYPSTRPSF